MPNNPNRIREIAWTELFPWLGLVRAVRLAFAPRMLILAAIALAATTAGWRVIGGVFSSLSEDKSFQQAYTEVKQWHASPTTPVTRNALDGVILESPLDYAEKSRLPFVIPGVSVRVLDPADSQATLPWNMLSEPFRKLFANEITVTSFLYLMACGVWALLVWSLFGAAITRSAALWFAREDRLGLRKSLLWGMVKWPAYFGGPMFPLLGVLIAVIPVAVLLGFPLKLDIGVLLVGILWPLALLCGFFLAVLLVGLVFGWPLMWPTISAEGTDSFDALSRSYSYTYQRPVHYLFYAAVAGVLGALAWVVVMIFANGVIEYSYWAASWGSGVQRIEEIKRAAVQEDRLAEQSFAFYWGAKAIGFWVSVVITVAIGFLFSYFWCAATYIYFLLRQAVDATEMDEVAVEEEPESYGLPPLQGEPGNVPQVSEPPTAPGSTTTPSV
jgi:hypothetical protein